jgi:hypothetical protein
MSALRRSIRRALVASMLARGVAQAQDTTGFELRSFSGGLRLSGEYRDESRGTDLSSLEEKERLLREEVFLALTGSAYHPKFLLCDLKANLGFEQRDTDASGTSSETSADRERDGWDGKLRFFDTHPWSLALYSYRRETTSRQTFLGTTDAVVQESGADLRASELWLPSRLHAHHFEYEGRGFDTFRETRDSVLLEGQKSSSVSDLRYTLETNDVAIDTTGQEFTDRSASLSWNRRFGSDHADRWLNDLRWRDQDGSVTTSNLSATSSLHEAWSETLSSDHRLFYTRSETGAAESDGAVFSSEIEHRLWQSLTSAVSGSIGRQTIGDGNVDDEGGGARFAYRKETPIGQLRIDGSSELFFRDQQGLEDLVPVLDEPHVLAPGTPAFLDNTAVDLASIQVTDLAGTTLFVADLDYRVSLEGNRARLDLLPGSAIAPNQTVLVDYVFQPAPDLRFRDLSRRLAFGLRLGSHADLDLAYDAVDQDRTGGIDNGVLQDSRRLRGSLRVYPLGVEHGGEVAAAYEDYDADFAPFARASLSSHWRFEPAPRASWFLAGDLYRTRFSDTDESEHGSSLSSSLHADLAEGSGFDLRGEWHTTEFRSDAGHGYLLESRWSTKLERLELALAARFSDEQFDVASDQRVLAAWVSLTRRF